MVQYWTREIKRTAVRITFEVSPIFREVELAFLPGRAHDKMRCCWPMLTKIILNKTCGSREYKRKRKEYWSLNSGFHYKGGITGEKRRSEHGTI